MVGTAGLKVVTQDFAVKRTFHKYVAQLWLKVVPSQKLVNRPFVVSEREVSGRRNDLGLADSHRVDGGPARFDDGALVFLDVLRNA